MMVLSYLDYIRVVVTAEKALMSKEEVNRFMRYVMNEIEHLYKEAKTSSVKQNDNNVRYAVPC